MLNLSLPLLRFSVAALALAAITANAQAPAAKKADPPSITTSSAGPNVPMARSYTAGKFSLEIDGVRVPGNLQIEGLDALLSDARAQAIQSPANARYRPGNNKTTRIKITREWSNDTQFYKWFKTVVDGKVDRRSISVIFHNDAGEETGRLIFANTTPANYIEPAPSERSSGHASEKLELVYETMEYKGK